MKKLFTSESVTPGHPDKLCDKIADTILDEYLKQDSTSRVAVEVCAHKNGVVVMGEVTSKANIDIKKIVKDTIIDVGYDNDNLGFNGNNVKISVNINTQSSDIAMGVNTSSDSKLLGAGDQGMMFGYATDESEDYMPYPISIANKLAKQLSEVRKSGAIPYLKSDGKVQVTVEYVNDEPFRIDTILISTQHSENVDIEILQKDIFKKVILPIVKEDMIDVETKFYINPTGRFVLGGAVADTGLTGRKIMVDTYGGLAHHGGGAFSGKDGTKVDRSASYMLRHIAKNVVANGLARKCEIQLSYAIGVREPVSIYINCFNTNRVPEWLIIKLIKSKFDLTPQGIIDYLKLKEPIFSKTTNYGHFGRDGFTWEEFVQI